MRNLLLITVACFSLGACATSGTTPSTVTTSINTVVSDIVAYTEEACQFQPDVTSVEAIITALYPGAAIVTVPEQAVASTICSTVSTVTPAPASVKLKAAAAIYYPGTTIPIHGTFLSKARLHKRR